jgi:hypothetical protein
LGLKNLKIFYLGEYIIMKLHEEFKLWESMWDKKPGTLKEDQEAEEDPVLEILNKIPTVEFKYDSYTRESSTDHFNPVDGHWTTSSSARVPGFEYSVDSWTVYEDLRDMIIPKYENKVPKNELLTKYLDLQQNYVAEIEDEFYTPAEIFLAENFDAFVDMFINQLSDYYEDAAMEWAEENVDPEEYDDYDDDYFGYDD